MDVDEINDGDISVQWVMSQSGQVSMTRPTEHLVVLC